MSGNNSKNPVGDWDVDDLLFWRALESHAPIHGLLKQVLTNGWTLCIPPDTSIPIGFDPATNKQLPMPTESFSKMHVLIPENMMNNNGGGAMSHSRSGSTCDLLGQFGGGGGGGGDSNSETSSNTSGNGSGGGGKKEATNKSFTQTILSPVASLRSRTASFFSSLKNSVSSPSSSLSSSKNNDKNSNKSNSNCNNNNRNNNSRVDSSCASPTTTRQAAAAALTSTEISPNVKANLGPPQAAQRQFQQSKFFAGGRKDLVVYRRTTAEELLLLTQQRQQQSKGGASSDDDDDANVGNNRKSQHLVQNSLLREICKRKRFSDDAHSKSLDSSDLGVLVTEWGPTPNQRTVARIVFEQKVINTASKRSVTFLVLDRPLNAGAGAIPAHLRTFGFAGQSVTDAVDFLFDADSEFVNDEDSLFSLLEKKAAAARAYLDETYASRLDDDGAESAFGREKQGARNQQSQQSQHEQDNHRQDETILDRVRDYIDDIINTESDTWNMAIVPAAHPLSRRRLERSFHIAISSFVHSKVYQVVFSLCSNPRCNPSCAEGEVNRWKEVRRKFDAVAGGDDDPVHLGLAPDVWDSLRNYDSILATSVQKAIDSVSAATNPFDKVQRLEKVYQSVVDPIVISPPPPPNTTGLPLRGLQPAAAAAAAPSSPSSSSTSSSSTTSCSAPAAAVVLSTRLAADSVIPLLAYYLLRSARCELLPVHIAYIRCFGNEAVLGGASSNYEYALATLEVALSVACSVFDPPPFESNNLRRKDQSGLDDGDEKDDDEDEGSDDDDDDQTNNNEHKFASMTTTTTTTAGTDVNDNNKTTQNNNSSNKKASLPPSPTSSSASATNRRFPPTLATSSTVTAPTGQHQQQQQQQHQHHFVPSLQHSPVSSHNSMNRFEASVIRSTQAF